MKRLSIACGLFVALSGVAHAEMIQPDDSCAHVAQMVQPRISPELGRILQGRLTQWLTDKNDLNYVQRAGTMTPSEATLAVSQSIALCHQTVNVSELYIDVLTSVLIYDFSH